MHSINIYGVPSTHQALCQTTEHCAQKQGSNSWDEESVCKITAGNGCA